MRENFKNIISLFLLFIFIFPTVVKLEHDHEHFVCKAKGEQHLHQLQAKCDICSFEFSVFSSVENSIQIEKPRHVIYFCNNYESPNYSSYSAHTFLLRAPPHRQV